MSKDSPNIFVRLLRGIWNTLNFTRRLVFNLIFLVIVVAIFVAVFSSRPIIEPRTALVLDPRGDIVEQYTIDPAQRALGNLAGFFGPFVMGWLKDATGSFSAGLLVLAACGIVGTGIVLLLGHDTRLEEAPGGRTRPAV